MLEADLARRAASGGIRREGHGDAARLIEAIDYKAFAGLK
jgi:hypothetical protein